MKGKIESRVLSFFLSNPDVKPKQAAVALRLDVRQVYTARYRLRRNGQVLDVEEKKTALKLKKYYRKIVKTGTSKNRPMGKKRLWAITWEPNQTDREFKLVSKLNDHFGINLDNYNYSQKVFKILANSPSPAYPKIAVGTE